MRYLVDTHALLWWLSGDAKLSRMARETLGETSHDVFVSAASAWEITTKVRLGKLEEARRFAGDVQSRIIDAGFLPLSVTMAQAETAGRLKGDHRDPFDRMLMAQALLDNLTLISNETAFDAFGVSRLW